MYRLIILVTETARDILESQTAFFVFCIILQLNVGTGETLCDTPGWFGKDCSYRCHCGEENTCVSNGDCESACQAGWFGPQCQYKDVAYKSQDNATEPPTLGSELTDGDPFTCIDMSNSSITVDFPPTLFTWMRLQASWPDFLDTVKVELSKDDTLHWDRIDAMTLDIHGSGTVHVRHAVLTSSHQDACCVCSLHVSGGRNVALKNPATINDAGHIKDASKITDGHIGSYLNAIGTCSVGGSLTEGQMPMWSLEFSTPVALQSLAIFVGSEWSCKLRLLLSHKSLVVDLSRDPLPWNSSVYNILVPWSGAVYRIHITGEGNNISSCMGDPMVDRPVLALCEIEAYGDTVCAHGKWGKDCSHVCNCKNSSEQCFPSTGMCPSGCRHDEYRRSGCTEGPNPVDFNSIGNDVKLPIGFMLFSNQSHECEPGRFGENCTSNCDYCKPYDGDFKKETSACKRENGECMNGCKDPDRSGPTCGQLEAKEDDESGPGYEFPTTTVVSLVLALCALGIISSLLIVHTTRLPTRPDDEEVGNNDGAATSTEKQTEEKGVQKDSKRVTYQDAVELSEGSTGTYNTGSADDDARSEANEEDDGEETGTYVSSITAESD